MKKEGATAVQEIEKLYGLEKYEKTEFVKQITKEFLKYGKKLQKIDKYEELQKQGQPINKEMSDLLGKKDQFKKYLETLKVALDIYAKSLKKSEEPVEPAKPEVPKKDIKAEIDEKVKEFCSTSAKRLGYFFAIATTLANKDKVSPNPLGHLTPEQGAELCKAYKTIVHIPEEKDTSLDEEASRSADLIAHLLQKEGMVGAAGIVDQIMGDKVLVNVHYKLQVPRPQPVSQPQPQPQHQHQPSPPPQSQPQKESNVSATISAGKSLEPEPSKKETPAPVQPAKEEPKLKETVETLKTKEETVVAPKPEEKDSWADEGEREEEKPQESHGAEKEEPKEEDEFEVATTKGEERKKRLEEKAIHGERGRYPGRRRGRYYGGHQESSRGDYQGRSRGRGMRRGEGRAPRDSAQ